MKINLSEHIKNPQDFIGWFLMAAVSDGGSEQNPATKLANAKDFDPKNVEVKLTMNGVELNFMKAMERLGQEHRRMVKEEAKEIFGSQVRESVNKLTDDLYDRVNEINDLLDSKFKELEDKFSVDMEQK